MTKKELGELLKKLRKMNHYSVTEVIEQLVQLDVHIAAKTYYGYEAGIHEPDLTTFFTLCKIYKYDNLALLHEFSTVDTNDILLLQKYHLLDKQSQNLLNAVLEYTLSQMSNK